MKHPPLHPRPNTSSNSRPYLPVRVIVRQPSDAVVRDYIMNHENPAERATLGEQCHNAFRAGQSITTIPL